MNPQDKTMLSSFMRIWDAAPDLNTALSFVFAGWIIAPIMTFVERFLWSDWEFIGFLGVILVLDALTASIIEFKRGKLSSMFFQDLLLKVFAYGVVLVTFHVIGNHTVKGDPNSVLAMVIPWLDATVYAAILFKEALSINENLTELGYPLIPKFIVKKLNHFLKHGLNAVKTEAPKDENPEH